MLRPDCMDEKIITKPKEIKNTESKRCVLIPLTSLSKVNCKSFELEPKLVFFFISRSAREALPEPLRSTLMELQILKQIQNLKLSLNQRQRRSRSFSRNRGEGRQSWRTRTRARTRCNRRIPRRGGWRTRTRARPRGRLRRKRSR